MEGSHSQLCTGFSDGLSSDDADRLADLHRFTGGHVRAVAACADADPALAGKDRADLHLLHRAVAVRVDAFLHDALRSRAGDHMIGLDQNITVLIADRLRRIASGDSFLQALNLFFSVSELADIASRNLLRVLGAVHFTDDQIL